MHFYSENNIRELEKYLCVKQCPGEHEILLWEKVSRFNKYFTKIPGIVGIAVCNSLAMNAAHKNSDIDLFIITKRNRLWTVRVVITFILWTVGQRKTSKNHAGKFCLSFFVTENGLDFKNIAIKDDIYLAYWIDTLKPIINRKDIFTEFRKQNSLLNLLPLQGKEATSYTLQSSSLTKRGDSEISGGKSIEHPLLKTPRLLTICGDYLEKLLQSIFLPRTKKSFQNLGKPFGVVITDDMLKFHDNDRRIEIRDTIISS